MIIQVDFIMQVS